MSGVTGMQHPEAWTDAEYDVLDEQYAAIGAKGIHELLPHRSVQAIRQRAFKRGLSSGLNLANKGVWERGFCGEDSKLQTRLDLALRAMPALVIGGGFGAARMGA